MIETLRRPHCAKILLATAALCAWACASRAEGNVDVAAGLSYNSNLTRAQDAQDRRPDRAVTSAVTFARHEPLSGYDTISVSVGIHGEAHDRYRGLDLAGADAGIVYRRKLALGRLAPFALLALSAAHEDYREDVRDSRRLEARAELAWRPDERVEIGAGAGFDRRHALTNIPIVPGVSGAIFDLRGASAFVRADWTIDERWAVGARAQARRGDVESTSQRNRNVFLASDAIADDPAFEDPSLFGYRLRGTTLTTALRVGYAFNENAAIDVSFADERTRAALDLEYRGRIAEAMFVFRF